MTDPARTISLPISSALRVAELLDYLSDMAEHAKDHLDASERKKLIEERFSARYWARELRGRVAPPNCPPPLS